MVAQFQPQQKPDMSNKRAIISVVLVLVAVNLGLGLMWFFQSRSAAKTCVKNLQQIAAAEKQWNAAHPQATNTIPTWEDLQPFLSQKPACPGGGTYTLGRMGESPTCSLGGSGHNLPAN